MAQNVNTLYDAIEMAIRSQKAAVSLPAGTATDEVRTAIRRIMRRCPEIFWFSHQYKYDENSSELRLNYNFSREKRDFFEKEIAKVVVGNFRPDKLACLSELEKGSYVYRWIVANTVYNEYSSFNQTIYSVLINRNSVCTGYAKTAQYLLGLLGIKSELVFGKLYADKTADGRHCWNIVRIEDNWYHVDFCMADPLLRSLLNPSESPDERAGVMWNYFGKPTSVMLRNRTVEDLDSFPDCSGEISGVCAGELNKPLHEYVGCKSDSGSTSQVYLNAYDKYTVVKIPRNCNAGIIRNEAAIMAKLRGCGHCVQIRYEENCNIEMEQLTPWSELLNSHYYKPTELQLKQILVQLARGLLEISDRGIVYTDIHYNNIFVTRDGVYKRGDFGYAFKATKDNILPDSMIASDGVPYGSRWFMAPETFGRRIYTEASAVYSLSMLGYFVMNGMRPPSWSDSDDPTIMSAGRKPELPRYSGSFGLLPKLLCEYGLSSDVEHRIKTLGDFIKVLSAPDSLIGLMHFNHNCAPYSELPIMPSPESPVVCQPLDSKQYDDVDTDTFACTASFPGAGITGREKTTYRPILNDCSVPKFGGGVIGSMVGSLFRRKSKAEYINACVYAPAAVKPKKSFVIRVYMYRPDEAHSVEAKVKEIDPAAVKKEYKPLDFPVKKGDRLSVQLKLSDGVYCENTLKTVSWQGHFTDCSFMARLLDEHLLSVEGMAAVMVNDIPAGEMLFTIDVTDTAPCQTYAKVESCNITKIFISYAHADVSQVRGIAEGCRMLGKDYFFDRHSLNAGDIFKDKILRYIDDADLFVLCWSRNAAQSEWVKLEREHALRRIHSGESRLRIYPLSITPEAPLPEDMSDKYNFGVL